MARPRHPNKEIEKSVRYAETRGWTVVITSGHAWGRLYCPEGHSEHQMSVWSTPRNPTRHARQIKKFVDRCAGTSS